MKKEAKNIKKEITLDHLALMVGKGFNEMGERLERLEKGQTALVKGHEDIRRDLTSRVHIFDHKELEFRVERVEEKVGLTRRKYRTN
jgi:archaellum component FlaC